MDLCESCRNIPWHMPRGKEVKEISYRDAYAKLIAAAPDRFMWGDSGGRPAKWALDACQPELRSDEWTIDINHDYWPFLRAENNACQFCRLAISIARDPAYRPTYYGGFQLKKKKFYGESWEKKAVWIQLLGKNDPDDRLQLRFFIGDEQSKHIVQGCEPKTTFAPFSERWPHVILPDPFHPKVRKRIRTWLDACNATHGSCSNHEKVSLLPTRVLDLDALPMCGEDDASSSNWKEQYRGKSIRLVETNNRMKAHYMTLSYCWGNAPPYTTTSKNIEQHCRGLDVNDLPKTLQESIMITRLLGVRFIWIDCLCIVQDDKSDWERESSRMADIYSQSYLTVAASCAGDCDQGISQSREAQINTCIGFEDGDGRFDLYFSQVVSNGIFFQQEEPLQRRAWVMQERILAPRTLHFGTDQLYWECSQGLSTEDGRGHYDPRESSLVNFIANVADELNSGTYRRLGATKWSELVDSYFALNIRYGSDRLPALAGIISSLQDLTDDVCYAGLWKKHFLNGLLWYVEDGKRPEYRAPSWSFAAVDGKISYFMDIQFHGEGVVHVADFVECEVVPILNNVLGELKGGFAKIKGPVTTLEGPPEFQYTARMEYWNRRVRMADGSLRDAMARWDCEIDDEPKVLMITSNVGLLIGLANPARDEWARVGIVEVLEDAAEESEFESSTLNLTAKDYPPSQTLTLV